jgi:polyisoprenoid-binding protein YceI
MLRAILWCSILLLPFGRLTAQQYVPVDNGSTVQFRIVNHLIFTSTVNGYFKGLKGTIQFNPDDPKSAHFDVSVAVNTISTGIGMRDSDLEKEKYFNADKFPLIQLRSSSVTASAKKGEYQLTAALTIKGITKNISFPFTATPQGDGYHFKGTFSIKRLDFNVGPDNAIENQLTVILDVAAKKQ